MSAANVTKGMCSGHMGNMCPTRTRVWIHRGSHTNVCAVRYSLPVSRSSSEPLAADPRGGTKGTVVHIHPRSFGRCQLTRNAPLRGLKDDICTWRNFVNNGMSPWLSVCAIYHGDLSSMGETRRETRRGERRKTEEIQEEEDTDRVECRFRFVPERTALRESNCGMAYLLLTDRAHARWKRPTDHTGDRALTCYESSDSLRNPFGRIEQDSWVWTRNFWVGRTNFSSATKRLIWDFLINSKNLFAHMASTKWVSRYFRSVCVTPFPDFYYYFISPVFSLVSFFSSRERERETEIPR